MGGSRRIAWLAGCVSLLVHVSACDEAEHQPSPNVREVRDPEVPAVAPMAEAPAALPDDEAEPEPTDDVPERAELEAACFAGSTEACDRLGH